ncbi:MAG: glycosyltransferase [Vulcanimicrobiaceae bacterium]
MTAHRKPRVYWRGAFFTNSSLAIVNRRLVGAMIDRGNVDISIGTDPLSPTVLPEDFRRIADHTSFGACDADVVVTHEWPPRFAAPANSRYVHVQPWEYGSMPVTWFDALHDDCDDVWVHSSYNKSCYVEAGLDADRIAVVPHGVDLRVFNPEGPAMAIDDERFRFVFVGATIPRKGIDLLVNAYISTFTANDRIALMIKDADTGSYRNQTRNAELRALSGRRDLPRIEYVDQTVPDEAIAQIYRGSSCLVLPYRGEGFGLPVIEAMACGIPAIVTAGGSTDDAVDDEVGWRIPSTRLNVDPAIVPLPTKTLPWTLEPDAGALGALMRYAYEHGDEVRERGTRAARRIREGWTWDHAAAVAETRLLWVLERDAVPPSHRQKRYAEAAPYAERIFGTSELDGVILELFRRLGTVGPYYVEVTRGDFSAAPTLARGVSWPGIAIVDGAASEIARRVSDSACLNELDFLSLDCNDTIAAFEAVRRYRPRVVACAGSAPLDSGYSCIARSKNGEYLFVRNDLVARAGFEPA